MSKVIKLKKGLDIQIKGEPANNLEHIDKPETFAIKPTDFHGLVPKLLVKAGDKVKAGTPLFFDKYQPEVQYVSPENGEVTAINRGERRRILEVVVTIEHENLSEDFLKGDPQELSSETIKASSILTNFAWRSPHCAKYNSMRANPLKNA